MNRKEEARQLRKAGLSLNEIAQKVKAAKSSVSLWVRDIPQPEKFTKEYVHEQKLKRIREKRKNKRVRKEKVKSGSGRWMVPAPLGYKGKTYIRGLYVYESRLVMERKLKRLLGFNEIVHHIDENKLNNDEDNLELRTRKGHTGHHHKKKEMMSLVCKWCGKEFPKEVTEYKSKKKIGQKNFFCSLSHSVSHQQKERRKNKS